MRRVRILFKMSFSFRQKLSESFKVIGVVFFKCVYLSHFGKFHLRHKKLALFSLADFSVF